MSPRSVTQTRCALCGAKEASEPRGEEKYCRDCWDKKIAVEEIVGREFAVKRYIRAHSSEKYLVYHSTQKRPCGQLIVVDDGYDLFLSLILYPTFAWDEPAYHLEGDGAALFDKGDVVTDCLNFGQQVGTDDEGLSLATVLQQGAKVHHFRRVKSVHWFI